MKVLMINHFPLAGSGSGTYTKNLAVHLSQLGHEVCVILPENTDDFERVDGIRLHPVYHTAGADLGPAASQQDRDASIAEQSNSDASKAVEAVALRDSQRMGVTLDDALPFNFPCFTSHPRSVTTFADLDEVQMAQYTRAFTAAIEEEIETNKPDIIHGQHVWILPALAAGYGIPLVLTAHGTDLMGYDKWPELRHFAETAMDACSYVISISKDNCALLEERFPQHADKVVMMRNGYDPHVFYPEDVTRDEVLADYDSTSARYADMPVYNERKPSETDKKEKSSHDNNEETSIDEGYSSPEFGIEANAWKDKNVILFAGKLANFKGVDVLLDAVSIIETKATDNNRDSAAERSDTDEFVEQRDDTEDRGMIVLIVGDGDERDALHRQAHELGLQTVRFLGNVDQQALRRLYNIADVSLVPSRREPFGLVAIEAMACGIPVIATNQGGLPDFVNDSVGALVEPEDAADLAEGILQMLEREARTDMPAWRREIAHYARTHYAQDTIIKELESLYTRACS